MKRLLRSAPVTAGLLAALAGIAGPAHAAKYNIHWYLGHQNLDYFEGAAQEFKKAVEAGSNGDIAVSIVLQANDDLTEGQGRKSEIAAKVANGEAEMGHSFTDVMGSIDPRLYAFEAPYLFRGYRHLEGLFEGALGAELLDGLRPHGIVGLSFTYSGGASGIATTNREIRRPEDLKGLKVGVFGDEVNTAWLTHLGAIPVPIQHNLSKILPLALDHELDAVSLTWRNIWGEKLGNDFRYVNLMNSSYLVSVTYINETFFNTLPEKYRALILKASHEAGRIERAKTIELNETAKRTAMGSGVRLVYLPQANQNEFVKILQPVYERTIERVIGKSLLERIRAISDAPEQPSVPVDFATR